MQRPRDGGYSGAVYRQRLGKHVPVETRKQKIEELCFLCGPCQNVNKRGTRLELSSIPCEGGFEYLHRSPASRKRRKGNPVPEVELGHPVPGRHTGTWPSRLRI
jgi:hypothetical protein